jgi:hypothetical protein
LIVRKGIIMKAAFLLFMSIFFTGIFAGCSSETVTNSQPDNNLLINGSFAINQNFSLKGWSVRAADSTFVTSSTDVPYFWDRYSVKLKNEWTFPGTITQTAAVPLGMHQYRLSAWGKTTQTYHIAGGEMGMAIQRSDSVGEIKWLGFSDSTW